MLLAACVFAGLAALLHVYIFVLESVRWEHPSTRRTFGTTPETAAITKPLAYNQGFYNLFLAIGAFIGIGCVALAAGAPVQSAVGWTLVFSCCGRGEGLFGRAHHDSTVVQERLGRIPVAGFFAHGEIGPVGGRNFLHGYTASVALFSQPDDPPEN